MAICRLTAGHPVNHPLRPLLRNRQPPEHQRRRLELRPRSGADSAASEGRLDLADGSGEHGDEVALRLGRVYPFIPQPDEVSLILLQLGDLLLPGLDNAVPRIGGDDV